MEAEKERRAVSNSNPCWKKIKSGRAPGQIHAHLIVSHKPTRPCPEQEIASIRTFVAFIATRGFRVRIRSSCSVSSVITKCNRHSHQPRHVARRRMSRSQPAELFPYSG